MANISSLFGNVAFKPDQVESVETNFEPIPKGQYLVHITESEILPNNAGTGNNLTFKLVVQDGKYKNRVLFDCLCITHANKTAEAIAQTRLKQVCESLGIKALKDTTQIHDKPLIADINVELDKYKTEKSGSNEYRNSIRAYLKAKQEAVTEMDGDDEDEIPW